MRRIIVIIALLAIQIGGGRLAFAQSEEKVIDIPTRPGVTQRFLYLLPDNPKAAVILFAGGDGGLRIQPDGSLKWGGGNFLVRTRRQFAGEGLAVVLIDSPSDHQAFPFLEGIRQKPEHVADIKAVIAWLKEQTHLPVWLIGTSRGTQSAAFIATQISPADGGPDGLVLTSTILRDYSSRPVTDMPLEKLSIPVLVAHHQQDDCKVCPFSDISRLMRKFPTGSINELMVFNGGKSRGDLCGAFAYHGFNGLEEEVVGKIAAWIQSH